MMLEADFFPLTFDIPIKKTDDIAAYMPKAKTNKVFNVAHLTVNRNNN